MRPSPEEQKGLIGELLVWECLLFPKLSTRDAVSAWRGPLGANKDF
ncbi:MAG: PD-(D/E)XK motif protein [Chloroflexi bacterium]|nr:PD-(D/E)XK motif protein [Chloroflexota bacterium]